jgi:hypothetical protein
VTLTLCSDLTVAGWITAREVAWDRLVTFGPSGFQGYARLRFLPDPEFAGQHEGDVQVDDDVPSESERLGAAVEVLRRHTRTPDDCYFCLWDGWGSNTDGDEEMPAAEPFTGVARPGWQRAPTTAGSASRPRVVVPHRAFFLFHGTLDDLGQWDLTEVWPDQPGLGVPDPAFIWPADHAWCVANDVDPHWAGIGASADAIDELERHSLLDVVPADPTDQQPAYR